MTLPTPGEKRKLLARRLLEISIVCFVVTYPFSVWWCNAFIVLICFFGIFTSTLEYKLETLKATPAFWFMMVYFVITAIGYLYSSDERNARAFIERSLSFFLMPVFFGTAKLEEAFVKRLFLIFVGVTVVAALYCLGCNVIYFRNNNISFDYFFYWEYTYEHLTAFIDLHPTYFSILILMSIVTLVFAFEKYLVIRIVLVAFLSVFQIMVGAKIGVLLLFFIFNALAIGYIIKHKRKRLLTLYVVINIVTLVGLYNTPVVYWRFRRAFESATSTPGFEGTDYRLLHWSCAVEVIKKNPLVGVGTGDALGEINDCYKSRQKDELIGYNAHNQLLETWMKAGILVLSLFSSF
jgi:O-antigen ligase